MLRRSLRCSRSVNCPRRSLPTLFAALVLAFAGSAVAQRDPGEVASEVHERGGYGDGLDYYGSGGGSRSFPFSGMSTPRADGRRFVTGNGAGDATDRVTGRGARGQPSEPSFNWGGGLGGPGMSTVLLIGVVILLLVLLVVLIYALRGQREEPPAVKRPRSVVVPGAPIDGSLPWDVADPDELAAAGKFELAIVSLLVQSLKMVGWKPQGQRSLTAREVLWSVTDARRNPLSRVVGGAERIRFAGDDATRERFEEVKRWRDALARAGGQ